MGWAIALHGGAGDIPVTLSPERRVPREATLRRCLDIGVAALQSKHSPLDVVELVVRELENCPHFNAGRGSVLTSDGTVEMEACIMDGKTKKCGAVSGLTTVVNPISLSRLVMEKTPHIYLAFDGAEAFAREQLYILMSRAQQHGLIKGVNVGLSEVLLTHLQFADDSILFCEAEEMEVCNIKRVLRCFEVISGLRINYHKSLVCGVNVPEESLSAFAARLHCQPKALPLKYLGLPLGANPNKKSTWKPVLDKVRSRLAGWKRKLLSFSGRLTLLKSVSSALPMFYLSLFKMPVGIAREFDKLQANFLWGGSESRKPIHLVKWDDITKNVNQGGLGVRRVRLVNDCMLLKWWWRFGSEKDALWRKIICSKYNLDVNSWSPSSSPSSRLSCVWKGIISLPERRNSLMVFYLNNVHIKVGNGNRTSFWKDKWCSNSNLKNEFPTLHRLAVNKEESWRSIYDRRVHSGVWNFQFRRRLYEWEEREVSRLNLLLVASVPCSDLEDKLVWLADGSGSFSVSSAYIHEMDSLSPSLDSCKFVWNSLAPPKVQFFCWLAWRNRIKSAEFLQKIGVIQANAPAACAFCKSEPESTTHLLLHCYFAWKVWADMMDWWDLKGAIPGSVEGILHWWDGVPLNRKEKWIWKVIPLAVIWSLWKLRNECIFKSASPQVVDLCELIKLRVALWLKHRLKDCHFSVQDFLTNLRQIRMSLGSRSALGR